MSTRLSQMPKPEAEQYKEERKLFLVPNFFLSPDTPQDGLDLLESYWSEIRDHVENLERSLGKVSHVYHEVVYADGDEGMRTLQEMNPKGSSFIHAMCQSDAKLEATEDRALLEESSDWRRCLSAGLVSEKVLSMAMEGYQQATKGRYEHIARRIDETLQAGDLTLGVDEHAAPVGLGAGLARQLSADVEQLVLDRLEGGSDPLLAEECHGDAEC